MLLKQGEELMDLEVLLMLVDTNGLGESCSNVRTAKKGMIVWITTNVLPGFMRKPLLTRLPGDQGDRGLRDNPMALPQNLKKPLENLILQRGTLLAPVNNY